MKKLKKHIYIFNQFFYPAYKAGGPVKSLKLIKEQLDNKFEIIVFTSSYDIDKRKIFGIYSDSFFSVNWFCNLF